MQTILNKHIEKLELIATKEGTTVATLLQRDSVPELSGDELSLARDVRLQAYPKERVALFAKMIDNTIGDILKHTESLNELREGVEANISVIDDQLELYEALKQAGQLLPQDNDSYVVLTAFKEFWETRRAAISRITELHGQATEWVSKVHAEAVKIFNRMETGDIIEKQIAYAESSDLGKKMEGYKQEYDKLLSEAKELIEQGQFV
jgi:hypothetical protein